MSATPKIPDSLIDDVIVRYHDGWSLRRIATWLTEEKQLAVSRTAVSNALVRGGEAEPESLDDAWSELVEEAEENVRQLGEVQVEIRRVISGVLDKSIQREDGLLIAKLLAQQERILLWKLRTAGLRAPPAKSIHSFLPTVRNSPASSTPQRVPPLTPTRTAPPPPKPLARPATSPPKPSEPDVGRNAPCPCGSGAKYKKCHGGPNPPSSVTHAVTNDASRMTAAAS